MKKEYFAPFLAISVFELNENVAALNVSDTEQEVGSDKDGYGDIFG